MVYLGVNFGAQIVVQMSTTVDILEPVHIVKRSSNQSSEMDLKSSMSEGSIDVSRFLEMAF